MWSEAAGSLLSGAASYFGNQQANIANAREADKNREWQQWMSSTAHQREVMDLKAAGLNPVLSAGGGGASTPSGNVPNVQSTMEGIASSARDIGRLSLERRLLRAQADKTEAEADAAKRASAMSGQVVPLIEQVGPLIRRGISEALEGYRKMGEFFGSPMQRVKDLGPLFIGDPRHNVIHKKERER